MKFTFRFPKSILPLCKITSEKLQILRLFPVRACLFTSIYGFLFFIRDFHIKRKSFPNTAQFQELSPRKWWFTSAHGINIVPLQATPSVLSLEWPSDQRFLWTRNAMARTEPRSRGNAIRNLLKVQRVSASFIIETCLCVTSHPQRIRKAIHSHIAQDICLFWFQRCYSTLFET